MNRVSRLLLDCGIEPVLVDVGASGASPDVWRMLAPASVYVGFDPDLREIREEATAGFRRSVMLPLAVTASTSTESRFFLTRSPFCSSTLEPDTAALEPYLFAHLFEVERTATVQSTTLADAMGAAGVGHVDWVKTDTQGTDLSVLRSLGPLFDRVLAIDIEPGLIDAYRHEEHFDAVHAALRDAGFWMSRAEVKGSPRCRRASLAAVCSEHGLDVERVGRSLPIAPGWIEGRYLRDILAAVPSHRQQIVLWAFAMADGHYGHALDVHAAYLRAAGEDDIANVMIDVTIAGLRRNALTHLPRQYARGVAMRWHGARERLRRRGMLR